MRQQTERVYVALQHADGTPVAAHMAKAVAEADGHTIITKEQAELIKADRASRKVVDFAPANDPVDDAMSDRLIGIEAAMQQFAQGMADVNEKLAKSDTLNTVRFQAVAAEDDPAPSLMKYAELGQVLGMTPGATADAWKEAIQKFKTSK